MASRTSCGFIARRKARGCSGCQSSASSSNPGRTSRTSAGTASRRIDRRQRLARLLASRHRAGCRVRRPSRRGPTCARADAAAASLAWSATARGAAESSRVTRVSRPYSVRRSSPTRVRRKSYRRSTDHSIDSTRTTSSTPMRPRSRIPMRQERWHFPRRDRAHRVAISPDPYANRGDSIPEPAEKPGLPQHAVGVATTNAPRLSSTPLSSSSRSGRCSSVRDSTSCGRRLGVLPLDRRLPVLACAPALEDAPPHLLEDRLVQDADRRLRRLPAAGLDANLGDAEQPMHDVSHRVEVLDPRIRHVPLVAKDDARSE